MTRVCQYCKTVFGEKCGKCGSLEVVRRRGIAGHFFWTCLDCDHRWFDGQEKVTTGICELCLSKELATVGEQNLQIEQQGEEQCQSKELSKIAPKKNERSSVEINAQTANMLDFSPGRKQAYAQM